MGDDNDSAIWHSIKRGIDGLHLIVLGGTRRVQCLLSPGIRTSDRHGYPGPKFGIVARQSLYST